MNSPEEKARSLVEKFEDIDYCDKHYNDREGLCGHQSKEAALICIDEIIAALNKVVDDSMHIDDAPGSIGGANYYQQVKEAIQKL